jgi:hypothetical protein
MESTDVYVYGQWFCYGASLTEPRNYVSAVGETA